MLKEFSPAVSLIPKQELRQFITSYLTGLELRSNEKALSIQ
jgi:hypothetical protein